MKKLNFDQHEADFLTDVIKQWEAEGTIDTHTAEKLKQSFEVKGFDWKRFAQYSFWVALACGIIAIASLIIDDAFIRLLEKLYNTPDIIICVGSALLAGFFYYYGQKRKTTNPERIFSNEALLFMGVLFTASSIAFLGKVLDNGSGHFSVLFLLSVFVYAILGVRFSSRLIWAFALISLGSWFGTETGYQTDWSHYFLGMNYPLRFVCFGTALILFSQILNRFSKLVLFQPITYIIGFMYFFIALWLLSIFGNFGRLTDWLKVDQLELFYWAILSTLASLAVMLYGLKKNDAIAREFGIVFLLINLYSRYFEYLWNRTDKTIFFSILAISFWLIGRKAEKIWNVDLKK